MQPQDKDRSRAGLCADCANASKIPHPRGGPDYWRCLHAQADPGYPKYPGLPVIHCAAFREKYGEEVEQNPETQR